MLCVLTLGVNPGVALQVAQGLTQIEEEAVDVGGEEAGDTHDQPTTSTSSTSTFTAPAPTPTITPAEPPTTSTQSKKKTKAAPAPAKPANENRGGATRVMGGMAPRPLAFDPLGGLSKLAAAGVDVSKDGHAARADPDTLPTDAN